MKRSFSILVLLTLILFLTSCSNNQITSTPQVIQAVTVTFTPYPTKIASPTLEATLPVFNTVPGQLTPCQDVYGTYYSYIPNNITSDSNILVVVHGTPLDGTPEQNAVFYAASWQDFAEANDLVLIVPAFDQEHFSSRYGDIAMGGYRGLFGREISADAWVNKLVEDHRQALGLNHQPFYLYGHSAGGQFVARYVVMHPDEIQRAVITSAATYPQPDPAIQWPFGMGELHSELTWEDGATQQVNVAPNQETWLEAVQVPLTVIVGLDDTYQIPVDLLPGQKGTDRITIGRNWVTDMNAFAEANGVESQITLELFPGVGHSMSKLISFSQNALLAGSE
ncbi:MAG: alpha/beta fold hydrolase [Anaerolineaceae bacterium]|nr:alpha/beta fold hydrolase [Anaerolineaceae bacterium]